jgi:hypothetical protein
MGIFETLSPKCHLLSQDGGSLSLGNIKNFLVVRVLIIVHVPPLENGEVVINDSNPRVFRIPYFVTA